MSIFHRQHRVCLKKPHAKQQMFLSSNAKRIIIRAGRRGGKTIGVVILAIQAFLAGRRVLYVAPTAEQLATFWREVKLALAELVAAGVFYKNETEHIIEVWGTNQRIRAKTAWNADTLRGDYADLLILDEWQLMDESAWEEVGAPMLLDNDGAAVFIYTPPSLHSRSVTRARDPRHASKLFAMAQRDTTGRWAAFHFSSKENPYISEEGLAEITFDMTSLAYRQEIMAEDIDEVPGALWSRALFEQGRVPRSELPRLDRIVVAIDPSVTSKETSAEAGIIVAGIGRNGHAYVLEDLTRRDTPRGWASIAVAAHHRYEADRIVAEVNNGGEMVELTLRTVDPNIPYRPVTASRGKITRAEPISALYEKGFVHHVDRLDSLEDEMVSFVPGAPSPNRMDALVWALTDLMLGATHGLLEFWKQQAEELKASKNADSKQQPGPNPTFLEVAAEQKRMAADIGLWRARSTGSRLPQTPQTQRCPECGSINVMPYGNKYRCNRCKWIGNLEKIDWNRFHVS